MLEIGIGISAALVPLVFRALDHFYWAIAPSLASVPGGAVSIRFGTSFIVLITPTFLMGGTLPVLTRFFTESIEEVERKVGVLYALNTFGAAAGSMLGGTGPHSGHRKHAHDADHRDNQRGDRLFAIWLSERAAARPPSKPISCRRRRLRRRRRDGSSNPAWRTGLS